MLRDLSSAVINHLQSLFPHYDVGVSFIYFEHKQTWKLEDLLGSILADVARPAWTTVAPKLVALYKEHRARDDPLLTTFHNCCFQSPVTFRNFSLSSTRSTNAQTLRP
jgi:hypothetical protein